MGISVIYPDLADSYVVCTSTTRPPAVAGTMIFETDTLRVMVHDGTAWSHRAPREGPASYNGSGGAVIGGNDFVGTTWTTIILSLPFTIPAWATTINWDVTIGAGVITAAANWDFRLMFLFTQMGAQAGILGASTLLTWRHRGSMGSGAPGGPYNVVFQAQRIGGTGAIRQSASFYTYEIWFT